MSSEIEQKSFWHRLVIQHRIKLSYVFIVAALIFIRPSQQSILCGLPLILLGEAIRVWASGHIHKFKEVTHTGPYALCRHPLYLGHFLITCGFLVAGDQLWIGIAGVVVFWMIFIPTMQREENQLSEMFGNDYRDYMARIPRMIPRWHADVRAGSFDASLVKQHRELKNIFGLVIGLAVFAALGIWHGSW